MVHESANRRLLVTTCEGNLQSTFINYVLASTVEGDSSQAAQKVRWIALPLGNGGLWVRQSLEVGRLKRAVDGGSTAAGRQVARGRSRVGR